MLEKIPEFSLNMISWFSNLALSWNFQQNSWNSYLGCIPGFFENLKYHGINPNYDFRAFYRKIKKMEISRNSPYILILGHGNPKKDIIRMLLIATSVEWTLIKSADPWYSIRMQCPKVYFSTSKENWKPNIKQKNLLKKSKWVGLIWRHIIWRHDVHTVVH